MVRAAAHALAAHYHEATPQALANTTSALAHLGALASFTVRASPGASLLAACTCVHMSFALRLWRLAAAKDVDCLPICLPKGWILVPHALVRCAVAALMRGPYCRQSATMEMSWTA